MWKQTVKIHMFIHMIEDFAPPINLKWVWCYQGEDLQRLLKNIAEKAHPRTLVDTLIVKWVLYVYSDDYGFGNDR